MHNTMNSSSFLKDIQGIYYLHGKFNDRHKRGKAELARPTHTDVEGNIRLERKKILVQTTEVQTWGDMCKINHYAHPK